MNLPFHAPPWLYCKQPIQEQVGGWLLPRHFKDKSRHELGTNKSRQKIQVAQNTAISYRVIRIPFISTPSSLLIEPRKKPPYFPLYWLFNRDPYNGLL